MKHLLISLLFLCSASILVNGQNNSKANIQTRFKVPDGYKRIAVAEASFQEYLQNLPLKEQGSSVYLYNGLPKLNQWNHVAVIDLPIGKKNLHQCADAVIHLRARYLYEQGLFDQIHFNFTNGFRVDYSKWMAGYRIKVNGNKVSWVKTREAANTPEVFWRYLETIFTYAGTLSLSKELKSIPYADIQIGDVLIQGGSPGHAIIVVDMAKNTNTGEPIYLYAQSYMPAQEAHIIINPNNSELSPWYAIPDGQIVNTASWDFSKNDLKRFQ